LVLLEILRNCGKWKRGKGLGEKEGGGGGKEGGGLGLKIMFSPERVLLSTVCDTRFEGET